MKTIYNLLHPKNPINKGLVEVFQMYEYRIYYVALDGVIVNEIHNEDYENEILDLEFLKKCHDKSKVNYKDLEVVLYGEVAKFVNSVGQDYDVNSISYKYLYDLIKNNPQHVQQIGFSWIAHGIEMTE